MEWFFANPKASPPCTPIVVVGAPGEPLLMNSAKLANAP